MCYSAQIEQDLKTLSERYGAKVSIEEFVRLYRRRLDEDTRLAKALDFNFQQPRTDAEREIRTLIERHDAARVQALEAELFRQRKRLADAERKLQLRETKAARESRRIAQAKVEWHLAKLAEIHRRSADPEDSRIFPFWYTPVIVIEGGQRVIKPMRYHCRPAGKPASYDRSHDGLYNARRDNLDGFWRAQFGQHHAIVVMHGFYENVARHDFERRALPPGEKPQNVVLHFEPKPAFPMLVACLWSRWEAPGAAPLESFAAITDEPPPEVAATGHNRCVVPIKPENVDDWLAPQGVSRQRLYAILDDRQRPYYEHRLAA